MPGKPAVRVGDTAMNCADPVDTPTGTVVATGTVLINGLPAAKQNDQIVGTDVHILMMPSPSGPVPTPLPHPFSGIINVDCEPTVKIMGQPAAVVGSKATNTPPHIPQGGPFQIPPKNQATIIMGSPNVFIGSGSTGSRGVGSGKSSAETAFLFSGLDPSNAACKEEEEHYLDVTFVDKGELPVLGAFYEGTDTEQKPLGGRTSGRILRYGIPEGNCDIALKGISKVEWSVKGDLKTDEEVTLNVETIGVDDGEEATFEIWERNSSQSDRFMDKLQSTIEGGKAEVSWIYRTEDTPETASDASGTYSLPDYYFIVDVAKMKKRSGILVYMQDAEIVLLNKKEEPIGNVDYRCITASGEIRSDKLDDKGETTEKDLPLGVAEVEFPGLSEADSDTDEN